MIQLIEISARKPLPVHIHSLKRSLYSLYSLARTRPYGSKIDTKPTPNRKANPATKKGISAIGAKVQCRMAALAQ